MQCLGTWLSDEGLLLGDAARAIGVSADTLRRWERAGKLRTTRDPANRRRVPRREIERLAGHPSRHKAGDSLSARNRFPGVVRSVEIDGVMALVEIEAGPHRVTAAVTRDAVEELGLAPGVPATAAVKATSVMVERGGDETSAGARRGGRRARRRLRRRRRRRGAAARPTDAPRRLGRVLDDRGARGLRARVREAENADVRLSFAGSDELAAQIRQGARVGRLRRGQHEPARGALRRGPALGAGRVRHQRVRARRAGRLGDRVRRGPAEPGTKVVVGSESVPIGSYTREALAKLPPEQEKAILANVVSNEPDVKGIVGKLTQGAGDAGFVYVTDVNATGGDLEAIDLPDELEPEVTYGAGVDRGARARARARSSSTGSPGPVRDALEEAGFGPSP